VCCLLSFAPFFLLICTCREEGPQAVDKWPGKKNIFDYEYIVVPVHSKKKQVFLQLLLPSSAHHHLPHRTHWILAIIINPAAVIIPQDKPVYVSPS
jgi:Ulp1 family protease